MTVAVLCTRFNRSNVFLAKKFNHLAVKAQMNLRVRKYSMWGRGYAPTEKRFCDRLWCV